VFSSWTFPETTAGRLNSYKVWWYVPRTPGIEVRVYGVTGCLSAPRLPPNGEGPCLVEHTVLPASALRLIGTAPSELGVVTWEWTEPDDWYLHSPPGCMARRYLFGPDGRLLDAIVLAAYNAAGHSTFAIAEPGLWMTHQGKEICLNERPSTGTP
jgi:hypothetical protein